MEKKPITKFLKVMSIIHLVLAILGVITSILAIISYAALPGLSALVEETAEIDITPLTWISIVIGLVCCVVDICLSVFSLKHDKLQLVYRISVFTMLATTVFNGVETRSIGDVINLLLGLILPCLFIYAVYQQLKLDGDLPGKKN